MSGRPLYQGAFMFAGLMLDLDGTLADTALDLVGAAQRLCEHYGVTAPAYATLRAHVSSGASAMLKAALGCTPEDGEFSRAKRRFLSLYARDPVARTRLFEGMEEVLAELRARRIPWCVVTNKPEPLARLVVHGLALTHHCAGIIATGTTAQNKPHGQPVRLAAHLTGIAPPQLLMIGDDRRDIQAAHTAGAGALAAAWGYIAPGEDCGNWGALAVLHRPQQIMSWLK
ncbi:MAG: HAD-IA family hydrolase [Gammaproteobacteria bacterium]|nr:HAD-IA family hydrolase [Gammaproteobacteria bacterium]